MPGRDGDAANAEHGQLARNRQRHGGHGGLGGGVGGLANLAFKGGDEEVWISTPRSPSGPGALCCMITAAARSHMKVPTRLIWMVRVNCSTGMGPLRPRIRPAVPMPAQFTTTFSPPMDLAAAVMAASTLLSELTSQRWNRRGGAEGLRRLLALRILDVEQRAAPAMGNEMFGNRKAEARSAAGDHCTHFVEIHQAASRSGSCSFPSMALRACRHSAATASVPVCAEGITGSRISIRSRTGCGKPPRVADERLEQFVTDGRFYSGTVIDDLNLEIAVRSATVTPTWLPHTCAAWQLFSSRL